MLKTISQSKLKSWEYCRAGYYIQYVLGLDGYNPHFEGGHEYHKSVELYHRGLKEDWQRDRYGEVILSNGEPIGVDTRDDELIKHYAGACDCSEKLAHPSVKASEALTAPDGHIMVEERMSIVLEHPYTHERLPVSLSMVIDRVVNMNKLDDLKTSISAWNQPKVDEDIQATLYLYAWWQTYTILAEFGFTVVRKSPGPRTPALATFTTTRTTDDFARTWDWVAGIITEINEATQFPCTCRDYAHTNTGLLL